MVNDMLVIIKLKNESNSYHRDHYRGCFLYGCFNVSNSYP